VLPEHWYPRDADGFRRATLEDLRHSAIFVQLLGATDYADGLELPGGYGKLQLECAMERNKPIVQWRSLELDPVSISDPTWRAVLMGGNVIACGLEEFKRTVIKQARAATVQSGGVGSGEAVVVVNASDVDRQLANDVGEVLARNGITCAIETRQELALDSSNAAQSPLAGLLIVYGACPAIWVRQQLWHYRKALARVESKPPICAVYEGPPQAKEPIRFTLPMVKVIDGRSSFDETALHPFIEAVRGRRSP
jgi:hypothetical protein